MFSVAFGVGPYVRSSNAVRWSFWCGHQSRSWPLSTSSIMSYKRYSSLWKGSWSQISAQAQIVKDGILLLMVCQRTISGQSVTCIENCQECLSASKLTSLADPSAQGLDSHAAEVIGQTLKGNIPLKGLQGHRSSKLALRTGTCIGNGVHSELPSRAASAASDSVALFF